MKALDLILNLAAIVAATGDVPSGEGEVLAAGPIVANFDNLKTSDGPLGLGVSYANIPTPYRRLRYSKAYAIDLNGDALTDLDPPSPPNVMACPNSPQNTVACSIRVPGSAYGFVLQSFSFACADDLVVESIPEALGCKILLSCATASGVTTGIEHSAFGSYDGGVDFAPLTTPQFDDLDLYSCHFTVQSATYTASPEPYTGNVTLLVDNLRYVYRQVS